MNTNKIIYVISCILFAIGATMFIFSNLGTDPLDVLAIGVQEKFGWAIGTTQSVFAIGCLLIWSLINQFKFPPISPFMTFFICGYLIDLFLWVFNPFGHCIIKNPHLLMIIGLLFCIQGSAGIIMSGIGIRAMDLVAIALYEKTKIPFWLYKGIMELGLLLSGWLLGGIVGVGTLSFLVGVGWLIQPTIKLNAKLGIPNFGPIH